MVDLFSLEFQGVPKRAFSSKKRDLAEDFMSFQLSGIAKSKDGVFANSTKQFTEAYQGETDAEGNYSIVCRGNCDYTLTFMWMDNQTDYEFPQWDLDRKSYMPAVPHLLIADGEKARFPDVALAPSRVVSGIVKDDSGSWSMVLIRFTA
jgi:hypothetical protein